MESWHVVKSDLNLSDCERLVITPRIRSEAIKRNNILSNRKKVNDSKNQILATLKNEAFESRNQFFNRFMKHQNSNLTEMASKITKISKVRIRQDLLFHLDKQSNIRNIVK